MVKIKTNKEYTIDNFTNITQNILKTYGAININIDNFIDTLLCLNCNNKDNIIIPKDYKNLWCCDFVKYLKYEEVKNTIDIIKLITY